MASPQYVYVMNRLSKTYPGGKQVLKDITLAFLPGAKIGVVGLNGAGKSTLLRIMAGQETEFVGEAWAADGVTVGYLPQEPELDPNKDVTGNVMEGVAEKKAKLDRYNELAMNYSDDTADEMAKLQDEIDAGNLWDLDTQVEQAMDALRCPPGETDVSTLSGGEKRRVALCRLLLQRPDILLLDEPTNHLDAESVAWLEHHLRDYSGTVVMVTHDRYFLDNITEWTLELDRGAGIPYHGNYSSWLEQKHKRLEVEGKQDAARERTLARELDWIKASPKARQAKSKARIKAYDELVAEAGRDQQGKAQITIPPGPRLGNVVIEVDNVGKGFGDRLLIDDLSFKLPPGGIVGVIGPNGAGKTTLFRMIVGEDKPDNGDIRVGDTVKLGYVDQSRDTLDGKKNGVRGDLRRQRRHQARQSRSAEPGLCRLVQLQGTRPAEEGRPAFRRRAQPHSPRQDAEVRREPDPARRAHQRSRCRDLVLARGGARGLSRLRRHHQPRSLLPRPHRHPHPLLRGRQPRRMVRGQFRGLRGGQEAAPRRGRRAAEADQIQEIRAGLRRRYAPVV